VKKPSAKDQADPAAAISAYIDGLNDWRGELLVRLRQLIKEAEPTLRETWKWSTPVWSHSGNVVAAGAFKDHVKLNFFQGAALTDPRKLFNAGLDAKATRAIDFAAGSKVDEAALKSLIRQAAELDRKPATK